MAFCRDGARAVPVLRCPSLEAFSHRAGSDSQVPTGTGDPVRDRTGEAADLAMAADSRYVGVMETAAKLLEEAMQLPEDEREELAAKLLDSLESPPGISIEDKDEIEKRAAEARSGAPGIPWDEVERDVS